jgi:hypothetical protein
LSVEGSNKNKLAPQTELELFEARNRGGLDMLKMEHLVEDLTEKYETLLGLGLLPEDIASHCRTSHELLMD